MTSPILFRSPDAGFDDPVEMWLACHERVKRFAAMLNRLEDHVARRGADEEAQQAATSIRRYFNEAAPRHHEDEEVDLFPRLRARAAGTEQPALDAIDRIEAEHLAMAQAWRGLDAMLARISAGEPAALSPREVSGFAAAYDAHIDAEENVVLPALRRVLSPADWAAVGLAMARRRGLDDNDPASGDTAPPAATR